MFRRCQQQESKWVYNIYNIYIYTHLIQYIYNVLICNDSDNSCIILIGVRERITNVATATDSCDGNRALLDTLWLRFVADFGL